VRGLAGIPTRDLDEIIEDAREDLLQFQSARLYVTGGTGFIGKWLLASVLHANRRLACHITLDVLTRNPQRFASEAPDIACAEGVRLIRGDIMDPPASDGHYDGFVHAATSASASLNAGMPRVMLDTIVQGGRRILDIARAHAGVPLLFTSSGAVYGAQPADVGHVDEAYLGGPDPLDPSSAYAEGKRTGELQWAITARDGHRATIARLFAIVGPHLPLERHFAVGNFLRDALLGGPIRIEGDGTPIRSYLYVGDVIAWLWAIFARGVSGRAYNVGSEEALDLTSLARTIAGIAAPGAAISIARAADPSRPAHRYVPSTRRIIRELGVRQRVGLPEAIRRTVTWHRTPSG